MGDARRIRLFSTSSRVDALEFTGKSESSSDYGGSVLDIRRNTEYTEKVQSWENTPCRTWSPPIFPSIRSISK